MVAAWLGIKPEVEEEEAKFSQDERAAFDKWLTDHMEKVQADGGMVSNMVVQAQEGSP
jgi:hypothetical protein